jgi:hypothetical protein
VASYVDPNYVGLLADEITSTYKSYWMDDADKRGDWCDKSLVDEAEYLPTFEEIGTRLKRIDSEAIDVTGKDGEARNIAVSLIC